MMEAKLTVLDRWFEEQIALCGQRRQALLADGRDRPPSDGLAPNARQALALEEALAELEALEADVRAGQPYDCCAVRLDTAAAHLGEVTGLSSPAEVLDRVFAILHRQINAYGPEYAAPPFERR